MLEVEDLVASHERCHEKEFKSGVAKSCQLAQIIAADIMCSINGENKAVMPWDIYPKLFEKEKEIYEQLSSEEKFEDYKLQRKEYAAMMNAKRNRGEV